MDNFAGNDHGVTEGELELVDVTRMRLAELLPSDDTALANSLRRVLEDLDQPEEIIAAFANYAK